MFKVAAIEFLLNKLTLKFDAIQMGSQVLSRESRILIYTLLVAKVRPKTFASPSTITFIHITSLQLSHFYEEQSFKALVDATQDQFFFTSSAQKTCVEAKSCEVKYVRTFHRHSILELICRALQHSKFYPPKDATLPLAESCVTAVIRVGSSEWLSRTMSPR